MNGGRRAGGNGLIDRLRNNPVPAVMAGVGLAWLAFSDGNRRRYRAGYRPERYRPQPEGNQWRDPRHELMESHPTCASVPAKVRQAATTLSG